VPRARAEAEQLIERALSNLASFPDSPARQLLHDICQFVLQRDK
jgi:geranylgeranyl pyrophosphate synthase